MQGEFVIGKATEIDHFDQIISLQLANRPQNLDPVEIINQGYVTVEHSRKLLQKMNQPYPHIVAFNQGSIVGYALVMMRNISSDIPILAELFQKLNTLQYRQKDLRSFKYFVMGQICIDKAFRGQGLFYRMYEEMKSRMENNFDFVVTEVADNNTRSMKAHFNTGFQLLQSYKNEKNENWNIIIWDWNT